ncbi:MAG: ATP-binding protein [Armatimonadia bacterium]
MAGIRLRYGAAFCGLVVAVIGLLALLARFTGAALLGSFVPATKVMVPAAALSFALLGLCLAMLGLLRRPPRWLVWISGLTCIVLAILRVLEYDSGSEWDVSGLFLSAYFPAPPDAHYAVPGAVIVILLGACLLLFLKERTRAAVLGVGGLAAALGGVLVLGYLYGRPLLYTAEVGNAALPAAIALMMTGLGMAMLAAASERDAEAVREEQRNAHEAALLHLAQELDRAAADALQRASELEVIINSIPDGVMVYTPAGALERANERARTLMRGVLDSDPESETRQWDVRDLVFHNDQSQVVAWAELPLARASRGETILNAMLRVTWPDAVSRWFSVSGAPVRATGGGVARVVGIFTDVTGIREYQQELERLVKDRTMTLEAQQERLRALTIELVTTEQRERQRLATLVHDEVAQPLGAMKLRLSLLRKALPGSAEDIDPLVTLTDEATQQVRSIMTELSPPILQRMGLIEAVRWWAELVQSRSGLLVRVDAPVGTVQIDKTQEAAMFEGFKELLENVERHAQATEARVTVNCVDDELQLIVADNGLGFEPAATVAKEGFGLLAFGERMKYLGGTLEISSKPGKGTQATLKLPGGCRA